MKSLVDRNQQFYQNGFVIVHQLLAADDVLRIKGEILNLLAAVRHEAAASGRKQEEVLASGVWVGLAARNEVIRQYVADDRLLNVLTEIIGPDLVFLSDKVALKDDEVQFGTPWHQDWPYWKGSHKVSVWVALDETTKDNGCLRVIPGSHLRPLPHHNTATGKGFGYRLSDDQVNASEAVDLPLMPGDALFFHDLLIHSSYPNRTGKDRLAWIPTYKRGMDPDPHFPWAVAAQLVRGSAKFCSQCGILMGAASSFCQ
ncbi:MAG: phytanoyl-CoA dioxygenase family protein [Armatimonadetes bacterium]|nr:phytanoyl-CoA dioxygenase family protein [Armatimonadota bacterium]MDW8123016.1 phytanoyl-CoA dioxygenase family protein [Armatimonadota bacterium]